MDEDLTIVGPEPSTPKRKSRRKRLNVEAILLMAKYDEEFQKKLLADRGAALHETDLTLSQGEKLLLNSISDEQLSRNIREFRVPGISRKSLSGWAKAAAVVLLLSSLTLTDPGCDWAVEPEPETGAPPDTLPHCDGITPDILDLDDHRSGD